MESCHSMVLCESSYVSSDGPNERTVCRRTDRRTVFRRNASDGVGPVHRNERTSMDSPSTRSGRVSLRCGADCAPADAIDGDRSCRSPPRRSSAPRSSKKRRTCWPFHCSPSPSPTSAYSSTFDRFCFFRCFRAAATRGRTADVLDARRCRKIPRSLAFRPCPS